VSYCKDTSLKLAELCCESYDDTHGVISIGDTQVLIRQELDRLYIAFRGTESDSIHDWLSDLDIRKENFNDVPVHKGFKDAYTDVRCSILSRCRSNDINYISVTGHSLGAALAQLCAFDLKCLEFNVDEVYTFGCPRSGGSKFVKKYDNLLSGVSHRVVNNNDIVTRVPTLLRWRHTKNLVYYNRNGTIGKKPFFLGYIKEIYHNMTSFNFGDKFTDHSINDYIKVIKGAK